MVTRDERAPQQQPTERVKAARSHSSLTAASEEAAPRSAGRRAEELPTARALFQSAGRFIILSSAASRGSPRRLRKRGSPSRYMSPESFTSKVRPSQKKSATTIRSTRSCSRAGPTQIVRYCRNICRSARSASTASKDSLRPEASARPRGRCSRCFRTRATSASGCCSSTPSRSPIWKQPTVRLCRSLGYVGVFQCEFIEHEGEHLLIDFKPLLQLHGLRSRERPSPSLPRVPARAGGERRAERRDRSGAAGCRTEEGVSSVCRKIHLARVGPRRAESG